MSAVEEMLSELRDRYQVDGIVYHFPGGVRWGLRESLVGGEIYLLNIHTDVMQRGEGAASEALDSICELADRFGVKMFLEVERFDDGPLDAQELCDWYWRFGFRGPLDEMIREPR